MRTCRFLMLMLPVLLAGTVGADAKKKSAEEVPTAEELIAGAADALGGKKGGHVALAGLPGYRVVYRMKVHNAMTGKEYTAIHEYEAGLDGSRRLTVDVIEGGGVDSVAFAGQTEGWVEADGEKTEFTPDEVRQRIDDFSPGRLFQVPLELGPGGMDALPVEVHDSLALEPSDDGDEFVVSSTDEQGNQQVRLVFGERDGPPLEATFHSIAGHITYRFDDYRAVADGLVIPWKRQFLRNGVLLSDLELTSFEVLDSGAN